MRALFCLPSAVLPSRSCILLPTWNHLWFVAICGFTPWRWASFWWPPLGLSIGSNAARTGPVGALPCYRAIGRVCGLPPGRVAELFLPRMRCSATVQSPAVRKRSSCSAFLLARADDSGTRSSVSAGWRWRLAAAFFLAFLALRWNRESATPPSLWLKLYGGIAYGFYQWALHLVVLGFAKRG